MRQTSILLYLRALQTCDNLIDQIEISNDDVCNLLLNLEPNTGMGVYRILSRLVREIAYELALPLTLIYNSSLIFEGKLYSFTTSI